ncbi:hypothetical protein HAX54_026817 [Datura stramonium]|uniref:Uncharacterized protein n=1 Tax=Datura stramonium TaxID=4076 RepID=A0ABS8S876_DATST|nr:hypothetical protein [Datura stramonium]
MLPMKVMIFMHALQVEGVTPTFSGIGKSHGFSWDSFWTAFQEGKALGRSWSKRVSKIDGLASSCGEKSLNHCEVAGSPKFDVGREKGPDDLGQNVNKEKRA